MYEINNSQNKNIRVAVAMSGGVDSSVAAALLVEKGYDVIGLTMDLGTTAGLGQEEGCGPATAAASAREVCAKLGIPHYLLDFRELFAEKVVAYFTGEYLRGRTPNPCVVCNRYIKFGALLQKAGELGAAFLATGHYARIEYDAERKRHLLYRSKDKRKDQSYFLYRLIQEQLRQILFPLGGYSKDQIREKARELGLAVADRPESQEICFIPGNDYKRFISERAAANEIKPGPFLNTKKEVVGQHRGLPYYTVGQRKGLGLALGRPVYVVALDPADNSVIIGTDQELYYQGLWATDHNFIAIDPPAETLEVEAKIRSGAKPARALITAGPRGRFKVLFTEPQRAVTPGQSVVYYRGDLVVGGGIIQEAIREEL